MRSPTQRKTKEFKKNTENCNYFVNLRAVQWLKICIASDNVSQKIINLFECFYIHMLCMSRVRKYIKLRCELIWKYKWCDIYYYE